MSTVDDAAMPVVGDLTHEELLFWDGKLTELILALNNMMAARVEWTAADDLITQQLLIRHQTVQQLVLVIDRICVALSSRAFPDMARMRKELAERREEADKLLKEQAGGGCCKHECK